MRKLGADCEGVLVPPGGRHWGKRKDRASFRSGSWAWAHCSPLCSTTGKILKPTGLLLDPASFSLLHLCWESVYVAADLYLWVLRIKRLAPNQQGLTRASVQFLDNFLIPLFLPQSRYPLLTQNSNICLNTHICILYYPRKGGGGIFFQFHSPRVKWRCYAHFWSNHCVRRMICADWLVSGHSLHVIGGGALSTGRTHQKNQLLLGEAGIGANWSFSCM